MYQQIKSEGLVTFLLIGGPVGRPWYCLVTDEYIAVDLSANDFRGLLENRIKHWPTKCSIRENHLSTY